jgi:hypothetical protein
LISSIRRARDQYLALPRFQFEALTAALALLVGLLVLPALIWIAGRYTLGAYSNGGVFALYFDFFKGLIQLRPSCWVALVGPFFFLTVFRLFRRLLRVLK